MRLTPVQLLKFVGNPNAYAKQNKDGTWYPVREPLTTSVLSNHVRMVGTVGTYIVHGDQAKTLVVDVDSGEDALEQTIAICDALNELGIPYRSMCKEFSGNKGYHVWVLVHRYVPASWLRRLGKAALALSGVKDKVDIFPAQDSVRSDNPNALGNLVKLPSGVHQVTGKPNNIIDKMPQPLGVSVLEGIVNALPQEAVRISNSNGFTPVECLANIQAGVGEGWRNHGMFQFATSMRRAGMADEPLWAAMQTVNAGFKPPMDEEELQQILESSRNSGPICDQLPEDQQCATCPFRQQKLYTKPGQVRHGTRGELAVVELGSRRANGSIEIIHPDISNGLVRT